ncbi:MAG: sigma-E processing peptidase SpoIIGA [Clostridiales bacterium]|nr:sigma-E processing peptidase SpoIIGA [Clostridiales bacterium]
MRVVYLDSLFAFNFALNCLVLDGTKRVLKERPCGRRTALGAAAGALYAVLCAVAEGGPLAAWPCKLLAGGAIVWLTFGYGGRFVYLKRLTAFFCFTAALGGGIFGLYYLLGNGADFALPGGVAYLDLSFTAFAAAFAVMYPLCLLSYRLFTTGDGVTRQVAEVELVLRGRRVSGRGLIDTGCSLVEPISGRQAIVVQRLLLHELFPNPLSLQALSDDFRLVPYSTLGEQGFLPALRCDSLKVTLGEREVLHHGVYAAITDQPLSPDGSYHMILGHAILAQIDKEALFHAGSDIV